MFRANHASNYLTLKGTLNGDRDALLGQIAAALAGRRDLQAGVFAGIVRKPLDIRKKGATIAPYSKTIE